MRILILLPLLLVAIGASAETASYVVSVTAKKLYVYDDAGDELGEIRTDSIKTDFAAIPGESRTGIPVLQSNLEEGLVQVQLGQFDAPVWLETMAVELWPGGRLQCPDVTVGRSEIEQAGMTIGFGEHCEPAADAAP